MTLFFIFLLILLTPISSKQKLNLIHKKGLIIWNVGQGQWVTKIDNGECFHFDSGGEFGPIKLVNQACYKSKIYFSHWDWDHISFANKIKKSCIQQLPGGYSNSKRKTYLLSKIPYCRPEHKLNLQINTSFSQINNSNFQLNLAVPHVSILNYSEPLKTANNNSKYYPHSYQNLNLETKSNNPKQNKTDSNSQSLVYLINSSILIPGDSPVKSEKIWVKHIFEPAKVKLLILGHHGSRTSTSIQLLTKLNHLKMLFVSARKQKYKHPHLETIAKARLFKRPLIKTESWGNIFIEQ